MLLLTSLLGRPVRDAAGRRVGRLRDLVAEVGPEADRWRVTEGVLEAGRPGRRRHCRVPWAALVVSGATHDIGLVVGWEPAEDRPLTPHELLLGRDVLDGPVVALDPPRRGRVGDAVLEVSPDGAWVTALDLSPVRVVHRLFPWRWRLPPSHREPVPLTRAHPGSLRGHRAVLAAPRPPVGRLGAHEVAEVLTRVSPLHARDLAAHVAPDVRTEAEGLLHPHVRRRLSGEPTPWRRTTRLGGWRLHRPHPRPQGPPGPHRHPDPGTDPG